MSPSVKPFRVVLFFLWGLREAVLPYSGRCTDNQCVALFLESTNFQGAQQSCKNRSGQLFRYNLTTLADISKILPVGEFWLERQEDAATPLNFCLAVSTRFFVRNVTACDENLPGFLCQYRLTNPCGELDVAGGASVTYTTHTGFDVWDSQTFPQGTTAVAVTAADKQLESKHVCFSGRWVKAPWNCDVMRGGCEHGCNKTANTCTCPAGQTLNSNGVTCEARRCQQPGDAHACACIEGYRLQPDGASCEDVNECEEGGLCTRAGEVCVNTKGGFECRCGDEFKKVEGGCVNVSICFLCEHDCVFANGGYKCACRKGYRVAARDPTKCEWHCTERQCQPKCDRNSDANGQCYCPTGYILDDDSNSSKICTDIDECEMAQQCAHTCVNLLGDFRCSCFEGFRIHEKHKCLPVDDGEEDGSGSSSPNPIPATPQPGLVPPYIKAGSALGITVFLLLCVALLFFLIYNAMKHYRSFSITSLKHQNIDIFHLQQVTNDTYKRLSL